LESWRSWGRTKLSVKVLPFVQPLVFGVMHLNEAGFLKVEAEKIQLEALIEVLWWGTVNVAVAKREHRGSRRVHVKVL
jgi:hypothetical protein